MKIAAIISGHSRSYKYCLENWTERLYSRYAIDSYFITWNQNGQRLDSIGDTAQQWSEHRLKEPAPVPEFDTTLISYDELVQTLKPVPTKWNVIVLDQEYTSAKFNITKSNFHNLSSLLPMWYLIKVGMQQIKNSNQKYDYIIRFRPDAKFSQPLHFTETDVLEIPMYGDREPHDYCCFGKYNLMEKYCSLYDYLPSLLEHDRVVCGHSTLYTYLETYNIPYRDSIPLRMSFVRKRDEI